MSSADWRELGSGGNPGEYAGGRVDGHPRGRVLQAVRQRPTTSGLGTHLVPVREANNPLGRRRRDDHGRDAGRRNADVQVLEHDVTAGIADAQQGARAPTSSAVGVQTTTPVWGSTAMPAGWKGKSKVSVWPSGLFTVDVVAVKLADRGLRWRGAGDRGRTAGRGVELRVAEVEAGERLPGRNSDGVRSAGWLGLRPPWLSHLGDGVGARRQVIEGVMAQAVGDGGRVARVELAVVVQVEVDRPAGEARLKRDLWHRCDSCGRNANASCGCC